MKSLLLSAVLLLGYGYAFMAQLRPLPAWFFLPAIATDIAVHAGDSLQSKINAAVCGDRVVIDAASTGATFVGSFTVSHKCTAGNELTITSSGAGNLPASRRIDPSQHLARIRTKGGGSYGEAIGLTAGAAYINLDALDLADDVSTPKTASIAALVMSVNTSDTSNIRITRTYFHQKETGTNYYRTVHRAIMLDGKNLTAKWNYAHIIGYYYPEMGLGPNYTLDSCFFLSVVGPGPLDISDNTQIVWWNAIFTGGGDTLPTRTATLTNATTTSATFSNVSGLTGGVVLRMSLKGTGTYDPNTRVLTRTSGPLLTTADSGWVDGGSTAIVLTPNGGGRQSVNVMLGNAVNGNSYPIVGNVDSIACTTCDWELYETVRVTGVSGNVVNYTPYGINRLNHNGATTAAWAVGDEGLISDINIQGNTIAPDSQFAADVRSKSGNTPKGCIEIKNANRLTFTSNHINGYPCALAFTGTNQNGTAPWIGLRGLKVANNVFDFDLSTLRPGEIVAHVMAITNNEYLNTTTPLHDVEVLNNLLLNTGNWIQFGRADRVTVAHNTAVSTTGPPNYNNILLAGDKNSPLTNFIFKDNIVNYRLYGLHCSIGLFDDCWPPSNRTILNNAVLDAQGQGVTTNLWGADGILSPIVRNLSDIGFADPTGKNYRLQTTSPFKGKASDGSDPGINQDALEAALGFSLSGGQVPVPTPTPQLPQPSPSATPAASPAPTPTPQPGQIVLSGKTFLSSGGAFTFTKVVLSDAGGNRLKEFFETDGSYSFTVSPGSYQVHVEQDGWNASPSRIYVSNATTATNGLSILNFTIGPVGVFQPGAPMCVPSGGACPPGASPTPTPTPVASPSPSPTPVSTPSPSPPPPIVSREVLDEAWPSNKAQQDAAWKRLHEAGWQGCIPMTSSSGNRIRCWRPKQL